MKAFFSCVVLFTATLCAAAATPTVVDRIAVTVGNTAITESRVLDDIRVTAFLNGMPPDLSPGERRAAANRLVERILLEREIQITGYSSGSGDQATDMLADVRARYADDAAFQSALMAAHITEEELRQNVIEQARLLQFIDFRFRPAVSVSQDDAQAFYKSEYPAFWLSLHPNQPVPPFDEARDEVERLLVDRKVDAEMDSWLKVAKMQVRIVYLDDVFKGEVPE
jgi:hypothetical protein